MAKKNIVPGVALALSQSSVLIRLKYSTSTGGVNIVISDTVARVVGMPFIVQS